MRIGRYVIEGELGSGGMGAVYRARDPELARAVAIKLLHGTSASAAALRSEARALAALNHPGIVTVHEIGEDSGRPFLVMELLDGRSLRDLVATDGITRERAIAIIQRVASALAAAHAGGVLHRDIKPENIMVLRDGTVKVVDFGIARRLDDESPELSNPGTSRAERLASVFAHTLPMHSPRLPSTVATERAPAVTGSLFGTPAYMAPEVLMGEPSSAASDIYSLGVSLYELLAKRRPYDDPNLVAVISQVIEGARPPPLGDRLTPLVDRMMARDPTARPTATEVADRLRAGRSRAPLLALVAAPIAAAVGVALVLRTSEPSTLAIDVGHIDVEFSSYGVGSPAGIPAALAATLDCFEGVHAEHSPDDKKPIVAEDSGIRRAWLRGSIRETKDHIAHADLELVFADRVVPVIVDHPADELGQLILTISRRVVAEVDTRYHAEPPHELLERRLRTAGSAAFADHAWDRARALYETLVVVNPASTEGWGQLAISRSWTKADYRLLDRAAKRAIELSPPHSRQQQVWRGARAYFRFEFATAIAELEPVVPPALAKQGPPLEFFATHFLGEAYWHDGDFDKGSELLDRTRVASDQPAFFGVHVLQYAIARRDLVRAALLTGQQKNSEAVLEFAAGHYEKLADGIPCSEKFFAQIMLGREPDVAMYQSLTPDIHVALPYRVATAIATGDHATAHKLIADAWPEITGRGATAATLYLIQDLGDVIASSGLADETTRLIEYASQCGAPECIEQRVAWSAIATPLIGDRARLVGDQALSTRNRLRVRAARAEAAGDRRAAAAMFGELVGNPSDRWDYPERIALIRNLHALGDHAAVTTRCGELAKPPIFRSSWLMARRLCERFIHSAGR